MLTPELMKVLVSLGFPGVCIFALCFVILRLDKRNQEAMTARIAEAKETLAAFKDSTEATERHTAAIQGLTEVVRMMAK